MNTQDRDHLVDVMAEAIDLIRFGIECDCQGYNENSDDFDKPCRQCLVQTELNICIAFIQRVEGFDTVES